MSNARMAASSLLGTITNTANMVSNIVTVASNSVDMLGNYVNKHHTMQSQRTLIELDNFQNNLIETTALENIERREKIEDFLDKKTTRREKYGTEYDRLRNLLNPESKPETEAN